jgi:hypothetical protein
MPGAFDLLKQLNPGVSSRGYAFSTRRRVNTRSRSPEDSNRVSTLVELSSPQSENKVSDKPSPTLSQPTNEEANNSEVSTDGSQPISSAGVPPKPAGHPSQLQFETGVRLWIHVNSISRQPDGTFTLRGALSRPVSLAGAISLDQSTEVTGSGTVNGGHVTVSVTGLTIGGENYRLQAASGASKRLGSGPAIELDSGKVLEMWFAATSAYGNQASLVYKT